METETITPRMKEIKTFFETFINDDLNKFGSEKKIADIIFKVLEYSHRTLQQTFFRLFLRICEKYRNIGFDGRNEQSVKLAKIITDKAFLPLI